MLILHVAGAGGGGQLATVVGLALSVVVGLFTVTDVFKWIYEFLAWLVGQILSPLITVAQWVTYLGSYAWAWIRANGLYTSQFTAWVIQRAADLWNLYISPFLATLRYFGQLAETYLLKIGDRLLTAAQSLIVGPVLTLVIVARAVVAGIETIAGGLAGLRAVGLQLAALVDAQLFAASLAAYTGADVLRRKANETAAWVNHTLDSSGVIRGPLLVWSISSTFAPLLAETLRLIVRPDWQETRDSIARTLPPMDAAATLRDFQTGAMAASPGLLSALDDFEHGRVSVPVPTS